MQLTIFRFEIENSANLKVVGDLFVHAETMAQAIELGRKRLTKGKELGASKRVGPSEEDEPTVRNFKGYFLPEIVEDPEPEFEEDDTPDKAPGKVKNTPYGESVIEILEAYKEHKDPERLRGNIKGFTLPEERSNLFETALNEVISNVEAGVQPLYKGSNSLYWWLVATEEEEIEELS